MRLDVMYSTYIIYEKHDLARVSEGGEAGGCSRGRAKSSQGFAKPLGYDIRECEIIKMQKRYIRSCEPNYE